MSKAQILVVDDEEDIVELVRFNLAKEGYEVTCALSGEDALKQLRTGPADLVILDLMLPGIDGLEVARRIKGESKTSHIPIVMLTAKGEEADIVTGLERGADDYVVKPFSPRVLVARVKTVLRRNTDSDLDEPEVIHIGDLFIHSGRREVRVAEEPIQLTYTEFQLLYYLARRPGWVATRTQIVDAVRGSGYPVTDRSVDVQVVGLRKKLGTFGKYIQTVRGVGYRFAEFANADGAD